MSGGGVGGDLQGIPGAGGDGWRTLEKVCRRREDSEGLGRDWRGCRRVSCRLLCGGADVGGGGGPGGGVVLRVCGGGGGDVVTLLLPCLQQFLVPAGLSLYSPPVQSGSLSCWLFCCQK